MDIKFGNILSTLIYADIFDYPLNLEEVWEFLISNTKVKIGVVQRMLGISTDLRQIYTDGKFYFLKGRGDIVKTRKEREEWSKQKWIIAQKTANKLKIISTIKMIGVTGALAMENCKDDDIDLLIVTTKDSLWLSRFLIVILCPTLGIKRRKPKDKNVKDKICFNLFLDEDHLEITSHNLFLAHEVVQVKPIYNKDFTYEKFLRENQWVSNFLPNAKNSAKCKVQSAKLGRKYLISQYLNILISLFNRLVFELQYFYMKPKMTCETVTLHQAFFHPGNLSLKIEKQFKRRLDELGLDNSSVWFL